MISFLNGRQQEFIEDYQGTCLFPRRNQTEAYNQKRLYDLPGDVIRFSTEYSGSSRSIEALKRQAPIPEVLELKIGAYVMIRVNDPGYRFINGSTGTIEAIKEDEITIQLKNGRVVEIDQAAFSLVGGDGQVLASAKNFPINLGYATTIHKSQGATLTDLFIDLRKLWEPGQAYVALSRLNRSEGLKVYGWDPSSIKADPDVIAFYQSLS